MTSGQPDALSALPWTPLSVPKNVAWQPQEATALGTVLREEIMKVSASKNGRAV